MKKKINRIKDTLSMFGQIVNRSRHIQAAVAENYNSGVEHERGARRSGRALANGCVPRVDFLTIFFSDRDIFA